ELAAVVHGEGEADRVGRDGRTARPGSDDLLALVGDGVVDLLDQVPVDERAFLNGTRHGSALLPAALDDHAVGPLVVARLQALGELAPRRARMPPAARSPLATAHRVVDGVHGDASVVRADAEP